MSLRYGVQQMQQGLIGSLSARRYPPNTAVSRSLRLLQYLELRQVVPRQSRIDEVRGKVENAVQSHSTACLDARDWRYVPWVMWQEPCAADEDWFLDCLFNVLNGADARRSVARALVVCYVHFLEPDKASFRRVGAFIREKILGRLDGFGRHWQLIDGRVSLFDPLEAPAALSAVLLGSENLGAEIERIGLSPDRLSGKLARFAFGCAISAVARQISTPTENDDPERGLDRLFDWNRGEVGPVRYHDSIAQMATELLEACDGLAPNSSIIVKVLNYLVQVNSDPRVSPARWVRVSQRAREIAILVLVETSLKDFFKVIGETAQQDHWRERAAFWFAYRDQGSIEDAWVALGPIAARRASGLQKNYAKLHNASDRAHSAMILRIKDLVIVEWSHVGRCRFFPRGSRKWCPETYAKEYDFHEIHQQCSNTYLAHHDGWQRKFAHVIYKHTGITHPVFGRGSL